MTSPTLGDAETRPVDVDVEVEPAARVVANSAWMMLAQAVVTLVAGSVSIYAIRNFTTTSWGQYSTALALIGIFTIFCGPGLAPLALRAMTSNPARQSQILGIAFQALGLTFCFATIALFVTTAALGYPRQVLILVLVLAPYMLLDPALQNLAAAFNARSRLAYVALFQVAQALIYGVFAVVVITTSVGVTGLAFATVTGALGAAVLAVFLLRAKLGVRPQFDAPPRQAWNFLRQGIPIAGITLVSVVYARIDIVLISVLANSRSVALYTVPYSLVRLSWMLPSIVASAFFPLLSRRLRSNRAEAEYFFFLVVRVFFFLSVPISLMLAVSSPTLLPFVYGERYADSAVVLQIMAWTSVFGFQNYILWYGVLAVHKERAAFYIQIVGLAVNVALNAVAIPLYGPSGAAAALVVSDLVVVAGGTVLIHRHLFPVPFAELLAKPVGAAVVVLPIAVVVATRSAVGAALSAAAAYTAILLALRYVTPEEWKPVVAIVRAPIDLLRRSG